MCEPISEDLKQQLQKLWDAKKMRVIHGKFWFSIQTKKGWFMMDLAKRMRFAIVRPDGKPHLIRFYFTCLMIEVC